jgi:hypothetical protein
MIGNSQKDRLNALFRSSPSMLAGGKVLDYWKSLGNIDINLIYKNSFENIDFSSRDTEYRNLISEKMII